MTISGGKRRCKHAITLERNTTKSFKLTMFWRTIIWRLIKIDRILEKYEIPKLEEQIANLVVMCLIRITPWLVWLSGLSVGLQTKWLPVQFPVGAHAWVAGKVPSRGVQEATTH